RSTVSSPLSSSSSLPRMSFIGADGSILAQKGLATMGEPALSFQLLPSTSFCYCGDLRCPRYALSHSWLLTSLFPGHRGPQPELRGICEHACRLQRSAPIQAPARHVPSPAGRRRG